MPTQELVRKPSRGRVLIVDDTAENLNLLSTVLTRNDYRVQTASNGPEALMVVQEKRFDLILLDVSMPAMSGYEVCKIFKRMDEVREIPVIFISAMNETNHKIQGFEAGGVDYVTKPFHFAEVLARVSAHVTLFRQRRELDELRQKEIRYFRELSALKDQFVSTVSHDLKNPISIIRGYVDLLEEEDLRGETAALFISRIRNGADAMLALVTDLLDLARIESGMALNRVPVSIGDLLGKCVQNFELQAQNKHITLTYTPPAEVCTLRVDEVRFSQVINNLLSNAIKFTPEHGKVSLLIEMDAATVSIHIADSGIGIPVEALPHIFDRFYRVDHESHQHEEGTGLGLSIVKAIIEQHCGRIEAQSVIGQGSTFSIYMPTESITSTSTSTFPVVRV